MNIKNHVILLFILFWTAGLCGQELVLPATHNPQKSAEALEVHTTAIRNAKVPLSLPFHDDFSYKGPYPDPQRWADNYVFVNTGFAVHPKTVGVATFDILDDTGTIYDYIESGNIQYPADSLTSQHIDLSNYEPADSLVLSFYYQPQGRGGNPGRNDALVLQLIGSDDNDEESPKEGGKDDEVWDIVWSTYGKSLQEFAQDTFPYFKQVSIAITEQKYFREDFRFRLVNYASVPIGDMNNSANRSIWNIDYVYLDSDRSVLDAFYADIAFAAPAQSILRDYMAIPWSHYTANPEDVLRDRFDVTITNLNDISYSYNYRYLVLNEDGETIRTYSGGSEIIDPFFGNGYQAYAPHANPIVIPNPLPVAPADERNFSIVHAIREGTTGDAFPGNDTIAYEQRFGNYFAFDDGSPELVHLLKGSNPERVLQFEAAHYDVIKEVQLFFMETVNNQNNDRPFELVIYSSLEPEAELYRSDTLLYVPDTEKTGFITYELGKTVAVQGTFYVGLTQTGNVQLNNSLVLGFDQGNNVRQRLFVNYDGFWEPSNFNGALMIRPVMLRDGSTGFPEPLVDTGELTLYPNPVTAQRLYIGMDDWHPEDGSAEIHIFDVRGRLVYTDHFTGEVDVSGLQNGMYLLRLIHPGMQLNQSARFIISR
jgi:hypothetical protein